MPLSEEEKHQLWSLAKQAVESAVRDQPKPKPHSHKGVLGETRGCFVTVKNNGRLRGCIGTFQAQAPLAETVVEMGRQSTNDPRFVLDPITPDELDEITIEVSVLSPLQETENPEELTVGEHGIYIISPYGSGCFLPEVATELNWSAEEFLTNCCTHKAGLPPDAWKRDDTRVFLFTSEKFEK
ncbi:MAG: AmmeMemoRadiSam system protein A [Phycisphaerae bacterium]